MQQPESMSAAGAETYTFQQAEEYLNNVRTLYRDGEGDYRGQRSEEQQIVAAIAASEADEFFSTAVEGVMTFAHFASGGDEDTLIASIPATDEEESVLLGSAKNAVSLREMKDTWIRLWSGFNILTNRLDDKSKRFHGMGMKPVYDMKQDGKYVIMQQLFNDFQEINAFRFGAETVGLERTKRRHNLEEGTIETTKFDPDKAIDERALSLRAAQAGYSVKSRAVKDQDSVGYATHTAGKLSPAQVHALRREFPDTPIEDFVRDINYYKDVISRLRERDD